MSKLFVTCLQCGRVFRSYPSRIKRGNKYCSTKCMGLAKRNKRVVCCVRCQKLVVVPPSQVKAGRKYCSMKCSSLVHRLVLGEEKVIRKNLELDLYVVVGHNNYGKSVFVRKAVLIAEKLLGRKLRLHRDLIYFKDGNRLNCDWQNIFVKEMDRREAVRCPECGKIRLVIRRDDRPRSTDLCVHCSGVKNGRRNAGKGGKLTEQDVKVILKMCNTHSNRRLGFIFGVSTTVIFRIRHKEDWKHIARNMKGERDGEENREALGVSAEAGG